MKFDPEFFFSDLCYELSLWNGSALACSIMTSSLLFVYNEVLGWNLNFDTEH